MQSLHPCLSTIAVQFDHTSNSKTAALMQIAHYFHSCNPALDEEALFQRFWQREQMGATSIGHGIAIPHIRCAHLPGPEALLLRLAQPIDFNGVDRQPVDLVFGFIVPENEEETHLHLLKETCSIISREETRAALRKATNAIEIHRALRTSIPEAL